MLYSSEWDAQSFAPRRLPMCRRCHKLHVTQRSDQYHKVHLIRRALHVSTKPLTSKGAAPNLFNQPERESFDGSGRRSDSAAAPASAAVKTSASIYISNARGLGLKLGPRLMNSDLTR